MKFYRLILLSLVLSASVAVLSGCGKSSNPTAVEPTSLDTTPPLAPTALSVSTEDATAREYLNWAPSTAPDLAGYQVWVFSPRPDNDQAYTLMADVGANVNTLVLPIVGTDQTEYYRVRAVDDSGNESGFSSTLRTTRQRWTGGGGGGPADDNGSGGHGHDQGDGQ